MTNFRPNLFNPGHVFLSSGIKEDLDAGLLVDFLLDCHTHGDWGGVSEATRNQNIETLAQAITLFPNHPSGSQIISIHHTSAFGPIFFVTEAEPTTVVTYVMRSSEYLEGALDHPRICHSEIPNFLN